MKNEELTRPHGNRIQKRLPLAAVFALNFSFFIFHSSFLHGDELKPPAEAEKIRQRLNELEKDTPYSNQDGTITVRGAKLDSIEKMHILRFVEEVRQRLQLLLGIPLSSPRFRVTVTDEDIETLGGLGLAGKLCNVWLAAADITAPPWVGHGLARWIDETRRQHFADKTLLVQAWEILPTATAMIGPWKYHGIVDNWKGDLDEWEATYTVCAHWYVKEGRLLETAEERDASWAKWVTALRLKRWLLPVDQLDKVKQHEK